MRYASKFRLTLLISIVLLLLGGGQVFASSIEKFSPDLRQIIQEGVLKAPVTPSKTMMNVGGEQITRIVVRAECSASKLAGAGMTVVSQVGDVFTGTIALVDLTALGAIPEVLAIQTPALHKPDLTVAVPLVKGNSVRSGVAGSYAGFTGKDVIVGIIDTGIDIAHEDFKNPDGTSRILYLWDQTNDGVPPSDFTFGAECTKSDIDAGTCTNTDTDGHGTQVSGIAAGNGRATGNGYPPNRYMGMAPEADLIVVNAYEPGAGFFTDRLIDAISYIQSRAEALGKPVVINMSLGTQDCPHDGTSLLARAVDAASGPGKIFSISAGNEGNNDPVTQPQPSIHANGRLTSMNASDVVVVTIPEDQCRNTGALNDYITIIMWYETRDSYLIQVTSPNGYVAEASSGQINPESTRNTPDGYILIDNAFGGIDPNNFDNQARIDIEDFFDTNTEGVHLPIGGQWTITITALGDSSLGTYDLWVPGSQFCNRVNDVGFTSTTSPVNVFNSTLVASPGTSTDAITVAAFVSRNTWTNVNGDAVSRPEDIVGDLAFFSSPGPTRDNRSKPDITAPGQNIASSLIGPPEGSFAFPVEQVVEDGVHVVSLGTSFSAPMITGLVALMMQNDVTKNNGAITLQSFNVKNWLRSSAISDSFTGAVPNIFWGGGKLDALAAMGLNPPKGPVLTAAKKSSSEIQLDWTIEPAATSFLIERKIGEGGVFQPLTTVTGVTTYLDGGLVKDTLYTYRVTAFFNQLSSAQSNEASAIPKSSGGGGGCFISTLFH